MKSTFAVCVVFAAHTAASLPQYILFARPPGEAFNQNNPSTLSPTFLKAPVEGIGASASPKNDLLIGSEIIFSLMQSPEDVLLKSLSAVLNASKVSGVPVSLVLDGEDWWDQAPELWNWWNETEPGYNPDNVNNVEWYGPSNSSAVKIGWRDWGSQIRVAPQQNVLSAAVLAKFQPRIAAMATAIAAWYTSLAPSEKHLLACVKVGWEAGLMLNSYYYSGGNDLVNNKNASEDPNKRFNFSSPSNGIGGGFPVLGYAAAAAAGLDLGGKPLDSNTTAWLTRKYMNWVINETVVAGIPPELVVNHVGGQNPVGSGGKYGVVIPYNAGFTDVGVPGYSFYWGVPSKWFKDEMKAAGRTRWAASEWNLRGKNEAAWYNDFKGTLTVLDCAHVSVYNWDHDFETQKDGQAAIRALLKAWNM